MTVGPDGKLWFTEGNSISSVTTSGLVTEYPLPTFGAAPEGIAAGSDGRLWVDEQNASKVAAIDPTDGVITEFPSPLQIPVDIAAGPDGRVWIISQGFPGMVAAITTAGKATLMNKLSIRNPCALVVGSDGAMWIVGTSRVIERVTTSGAGTTFVVPSMPMGRPAVGVDGAFYFATANALDRMTTSGVTSRVVWFGRAVGPSEVAVARDGSLWVTLIGANAIARVDT